ncbi:integrase domain-containing protein [Burkholderia vietnamiensis]|uniref:integrase domain-containing protein n=1 Tax=Burkholderia vietnamiensis TaxID=60552 RepID=UPI0015940E68|nr:integrase domain-containing protein [Burkholderia vietnamiensis]
MSKPTPNQPRSIAAKFMAAALHKGAATLTKQKMRTTFVAFAAHAKQARYGSVDPTTVTEKQLRHYVAARIAAEIGARTIQNEVSHLRRALRGVGRGAWADALTNAELGVPAGTRIGTGRVVDEGTLALALARAAPDTRAWIQLERCLGLRREEMIESHKSLKQWEVALARGQSFITIREGTKGGRIRDTYLPAPYRERALAAVRAALEAQAGHRYLVNAPTALAAKRQVSRRFSALGLEGENSGHALRRAFCRDQYEYYLSDGYSTKDALSMCSRDLGHGEGRGRWVWNNYLRATYEQQA